MKGLVKCVTTMAENTIKKCAREKEEFKMMGKILDMNLVAREAHYHEYCRRQYTRKDGKKENQDQTTEGFPSQGASWFTEQRGAYEDAFRYLCEYITSHVIQGGLVVRITMLREKYLLYIEENHRDFYNANYRTHKLKQKILMHFGD